MTCSGGGSYQICQTGATFTACSEAGAVIDGSVILTDPFTLAVAFDLDIDGTTLVGPANLLPFVTCGPGVAFDAVTGTSEDVIASVDDTLEVCEAPYPQGLLDATSMSSSAALDVALTFDGSAVASTVCTDPSNGNVVATCREPISVRGHAV